jgi:hypothetical protein
MGLVLGISPPSTAVFVESMVPIMAFPTPSHQGLMLDEDGREVFGAVFEAGQKGVALRRISGEPIDSFQDLHLANVIGHERHMLLLSFCHVTPSEGMS